jgi:hypothetical protein
MLKRYIRGREEKGEGEEGRKGGRGKQHTRSVHFMVPTKIRESLVCMRRVLLRRWVRYSVASEFEVSIVYALSSGIRELDAVFVVEELYYGCWRRLALSIRVVVENSCCQRTVGDAMASLWLKVSSP